MLFFVIMVLLLILTFLLFALKLSVYITKEENKENED